MRELNTLEVSKNEELEKFQTYRAELYKEVYTLCVLKGLSCTGNLAEQEARKAVEAFDKLFNLV